MTKNGNTLDSNSKTPWLKPGVGIAVTQDQRTYIGFPHRGVSQKMPRNSNLVQLITFLRKLDGNCQQVPKQYEELVSLLTEHSFISWLPEDLPKVTARTLIQETLYQEVAAPEIRLFAWGNTLHSPQEIQNRPLQKVAIYGDNRLALSLMWTLQNSGFSNSFFYRIDKKTRKISTKHLNAIGVELVDVGKDFNSHCQNLSMKNRFLPNKEVSKSKKEFDLIICTIKPNLTDIQKWSSGEIPYLLISDLSESFIEIGPCVIADKNACPRCIELWRQEFSIQLSDIFEPLAANTSPEIPSSAIAYLSGFLILQLPQLLAEISGEIVASSPLSRSMVRINLLDPTMTHEIFWPPHPKCGCFGIN